MAGFQRRFEQGGTYIFTWTGLSQADLVGAGLHVPGLFEKSVQVLGNFGAAGTLTIEGSNVENPGANDWSPIRDPFNNFLIFSAEGIEAILEHTGWIRPIVANADGSTALTVIVAGKGR